MGPAPVSSRALLKVCKGAGKEQLRIFGLRTYGNEVIIASDSILSARDHTCLLVSPGWPCTVRGEPSGEMTKHCGLRDTIQTLLEFHDSRPRRQVRDFNEHQ